MKWRDNSKTYRRLINSGRWRGLRAAQLAAQPFCQRCRENHRTTFATQVHHIRPVDSGRDDIERERLMFQAANLMSLCASCHRQVHEEMSFQSKEQAKERAALKFEEVRRRLFGD